MRSKINQVQVQSRDYLSPLSLFDVPSLYINLHKWPYVKNHNINPEIELSEIINVIITFSICACSAKTPLRNLRSFHFYVDAPPS